MRKKHLHFIEALDYYYETEDTIFVHVGVYSKESLEDTPASVLAWIREDFYATYNGEKTVVFRHTTTQIIHNDKANNDVYFGENRVFGIDGGPAFRG